MATVRKKLNKHTAGNEDFVEGSLNEFRDRFSSLEKHVRHVQSELEELQTLTTKLLDVGVAISSEIDLFSLLTRIIDEAKGLLHADKGTLYLVDPDKEELYFHVVDVDLLKEIRIQIDHSSIAGYVASTSEALNIPDVYKIDKTKPFKFNRKIDQKTGYRTKSMLTVPMVNRNGDITGAVQLINKVIDEEVVAFNARDQRILMSLASQAAVAIDNAQLYKEVTDLFDALVRFSASAIDERDPATAGHSRRVARFAAATARAMGCFSEEEISELEYSAWLHDVGKIGVREHILVKENKLYPEKLAKIRERFESVKLSEDVASLGKQAEILKRGGGSKEFAALAEELERRKAAVDMDFAFIERINKPGFVKPQEAERIDAIAAKTFIDSDGERHHCLLPREAEVLKIEKGNLTEEERRNMNSHVESSFKILSQIPFSKRLRHVPQFAACHHERIDGTGYPHQLRGDEIPLQGKILALVDVYDALTAQDRPYKPAIPVQRSLDILRMESESGKLDPEVLKVFLENKIFELPDDADNISHIVSRTLKEA